jgi:hypothetical protein
LYVITRLDGDEWIFGGKSVFAYDQAQRSARDIGKAVIASGIGGGCLCTIRKNNGYSCKRVAVGWVGHLSMKAVYWWGRVIGHGYGGAAFIACRVFGVHHDSVAA